MPVSYKCEQCDVTETNLEGWLVVSIQLIHHDLVAPATSRILDEILPDLVFHDAACRDAWRAKAGV